MTPEDARRIAPRESTHVLVADNDLADMISLGLRWDGFPVADVAYDGIEGLERISRRSYDLIVLNYRMPRMNGAQMLRQLRKRGCATPVIMISAWLPEEMHPPVHDLDVHKFVAKPFLRQELADSIDIAVATRELARRELVRRQR